jgi:hypothetical protein
MPYSPEDAALLAQFAGQTLPNLLLSEGGYQLSELGMIASEAYDIAEAMLAEHKRRTASPEPMAADGQERGNG